MHILEILQYPHLFESPDNGRKNARKDGSVQWSQLKVAYFSYSTISRFAKSVVSRCGEWVCQVMFLDYN